MAKKNDKSISFSLKRIKVLSFSINEKIGYNFSKGVAFEINPASNIDLKNKEFRLLLSISYNSIAPKVLNIASCEIEIVFQLPSLLNFSRIEDFLLIPANILYTLVNIAIGTSRGILFEKLNGSRLRDYYFPIVDIPAFVNKSLSKVRANDHFRLKINKF